MESKSLKNQGIEKNTLMDYNEARQFKSVDLISGR